MYLKKQSSKKTNHGFTLLLTVIVIGVILSVTVASLNLAVKQVRLSADTRDSEVAFQAASAGLECIRYWRRAERDGFEENEAEIDIRCFTNTAVSPAVRQNITDSDGVTGSGSVHRYAYQISWGDSAFGERCSQMRFIVMNTDIDTPLPLSISNEFMRTLFPGYPVLANPTQCEPGGRCTVFSSQGYSASCPSNIDGVFPLGTIQREILVEF